MDLKGLDKTNKNSLFLITLKLAVPAAFIGLLFSVFTNNHRHYSPGYTVVKQEKEKDNDAKGMEDYFFNARKNITTNRLDFKSMVNAALADKAIMMQAQRRRSVSTLPDFVWTSMGPTNIGGRTRAILIDKNDPTHQTIFAGGVTGGIWKSTNAGGTWGSTYPTIAFSQNDQLDNMNIDCIAQDANGAIYIGTGEGVTENTDYWTPGLGYSQGELGGGIFKSTDDGNTWRLLPSTIPSPDNINAAWAYVNRLAIRPENLNVIYAGVNNGLYISHDSGTTWRSATRAGTVVRLSGVCPDVKISDDGSFVIACINGNGYYCLPQSGDDTDFTEIPNSGNGHLPSGVARIEFAIAPSNPDRVYASVIDGNELFGSGATTSGIFMTKTARTNGGYWYEIGPGGSDDFDPYIAGYGSQDQGAYDNSLGVSPANEGMLLAGGCTYWQWNQLNSNDTVGSWTKVTHYSYQSFPDYLYMHPDEHTVVFDRNNPNIAYFGNDGGIYKCSNISNSDPSTYVFDAINRNFDVTQYYSLCFSSNVNYDVVNYGNSTLSEGLGMGGGSQDNGSPYISGAGGVYFNDAIDATGGDGGGSLISALNSNVAYFSSDDGSLFKTNNLSAFALSSAYTQTIGYDAGANIDSVEAVAVGNGEVNFVLPVAMYENSYDTLNLDSLRYISTSNYDTAGATIWLTDQNGPTTYPYVLPAAIPFRDTVMVPDRVVSRMATGFSPNYGIWMNCQGASDQTISWMPIAGPLSKPTAYTGTAQIHCLAFSGDGDAIYAGTNAGGLFQFSKLNTVIANNYASGALWYSESGQHAIVNQIVSKNITFSGINGREVLSIATDPQNADNLMITLGNYGTTSYVYYCGNATSTATFTNAQGNLPYMPVYGSVLNIRNSNGTWNPNSAMIATEHGIYTTDDITQGSSTVWTKSTNGMPNVLALAIKQQTLPNWACNNSGDIYVGTHGRGIWASTTNFQAPNSVPSITGTSNLNSLFIYPNPMNDEGNIEFNLTAQDNVTIHIYDVQGKEMKTISSGTQAPGKHIVPFTVKDLAAGTYFASLTGPNFRKVGKFIVVK